MIRRSDFSSDKSRPLVALVLLLMVAYWNSLGNDFVLDDRLVILGNQLISRIDNLPSIMVSSYWEGIGDSDGFIRYFDTLYRPLVVVTYTLNYIVGGKNPAGFHIVNLALHLLVTLLLYGIARQIGLGIWAAFISAALFGVHPIHTEAVSYVVGRAELMMAAGVLASLWLAGQGRRVLSIIAFVVGLLSKEQAIVLPLLVPFYEFSLGQTKGMGTRPLLARYTPYVLVIVAYAGLRLYALHGALYQPPGLLENPAAWAGLSTQVLTSLKVTGMYLSLFIWPAALSADYSYYAVPLAQSLLEPAVLGGLALWLGLIGLAGWSLARRRITIAFCVWMTLLSYLPVSNLVIPIGTLMGERLFYLPSAGLCLLIGLALGHMSYFSAEQRICDRGAAPFIALSPAHILKSVLVVILVAMTVRTVVRNRDWVDHQTLLERTVGVVPNNAKAHAMLGHTLASASSSPARDRAIEEYQTALSLYPDYVHRDAGVIGNMSHLLVQAGRSAEA
jgi:protein O-mannosyl-transferase